MAKQEAHPPGTIALPCGEMGRFSAFSYSLARLLYPQGSMISMAQGLSIPRNLNKIIREMKGDWLWQMGDDHVFSSDLLIRLLDHEVDVVVPYCIRRRPPFAPVLFKSGNRENGYQPFAYDELPEHGLLRVHAAGTAGMLVRRHVLEAIGDPWFENSAGEIANEDLEFCRKVREAGFEIHADVDGILGHIGIFTITPHHREGEWGIAFDFGEGPDGALNTIFIQPGARET